MRWLVDQATGELADAIHRDLLTDGLTFDQLGWRGLWAYVTAGRPNTATFFKRTGGWTPQDDVLLQVFNELREINWRYGAVHFKGGADVPIPQRVRSPNAADAAEDESTRPMTLDEMVPPHVRALIQQGGGV